MEQFLDTSWLIWDFMEIISGKTKCKKSSNKDNFITFDKYYCSIPYA